MSTSKKLCPDCATRPGSGRCDAHRKYLRMGDPNPKKPCPKGCGNLCSTNAAQCLACFQKASRPARQKMDRAVPRKRRVGKSPQPITLTNHMLFTPPRQIPLTPREAAKARFAPGPASKVVQPLKPATPPREGRNGNGRPLPRVLEIEARVGGTVML